MEREFRFTLADIDKKKCPEGKKQVRFQDTEVGGLALRVTPSGSKTFIYYRRLPNNNEAPGDLCEITLGKYPGMKIEQARKHATAYNHVIDNERKDPRKKLNEELTYGSLFQRYIKEYAELHTNTWKDVVANNKRYFEKWQARPVSRIKRADIQDWVNNLSNEHGKHTANRNYDTMRAVFGWANRKDIISMDNPCIGVDRFRTQARERFVQPGEEFNRLAEAINKEESATIRDFFWMCIFTGARRANVLAMEWSQLDFELKLWRIPVTKNGDSHILPLTPLALAVLSRRKDDSKKHDRWVFPSDRTGRKTGVLGHLESPKAAWKRILVNAKITDLRIHDLRRTTGSYMAIAGVSPTIIGKALGHKSQQATAIYARLTQDPVRVAMENAQAALRDPSKLISPQQNNVVELPVHPVKNQGS